MDKHQTRCSLFLCFSDGGSGTERPALPAKLTWNCIAFFLGGQQLQKTPFSGCMFVWGVHLPAGTCDGLLRRELDDYVDFTAHPANRVIEASKSMSGWKEKRSPNSFTCIYHSTRTTYAILAVGCWLGPEKQVV